MKNLSTENLTKITFVNVGSLIKYLQDNYVFVLEHETQHIFVLDQSNPNRSYSHEYSVIVHDDKTCNMVEVK